MESTPQKKQEFPRATLELEQVSTPEDFLRAVDFNVLNDIFDELTRRSGDLSSVSTTGLRVSPDRIEFNHPIEGEDRNLLGNVDISSGHITLQWKGGTNFAHPTSQVMEILTTLMHESVHLRGGYKDEYWEHPDPNWEIGFVLRKGLSEKKHKATDSSQETTKVGLSLNEAVTEAIAHEVLIEYLIRTGRTKYLNDPILSEEIGLGTYIKDRLVLAVVIEGLSVKTGIPRDEVWKGFVREYMNGNTEMHVLLSDIAGELEEFSDIRRAFDLGASQSLTIDVFEEIVDRIEGAQHQLDILNQVNKILDVDRFKNVLGLR